MAHSWFWQQQEARMDGKASETTDSVNVRIMQLLHPTWINMGGYFNDGAGHGYVTPDFEHSVDACMAALPDDDGHLYDCKIVQLLAGGFEAHLVRDTPPLGVVGKWQARGTTRAEALARALDAMLAQEAGDE